MPIGALWPGTTRRDQLGPAIRGFGVRAQSSAGRARNSSYCNGTLAIASPLSQLAVTASMALSAPNTIGCATIDSAPTPADHAAGEKAGKTQYGGRQAPFPPMAAAVLGPPLIPAPNGQYLART